MSYAQFMDDIHLVTKITDNPSRKVLLHKREINRLQSAVEAWQSHSSLKAFFKGALIKCELAPGTGRIKRQETRS